MAPRAVDRSTGVYPNQKRNHGKSHATSSGDGDDGAMVSRSNHRLGRSWS